MTDPHQVFLDECRERISGNAKNKDLKKNIVFKKFDGIKYLKKEKQKYDLILIKQTFHLMK